jgi:ABC-2 type transport system permease protein
VRRHAALLTFFLQEALQYRVESAIYFLWDVLPPIMMAFLWLAAYDEQSLIAGYTLSDMLIYTVGVMVLRTIITSHIEWGMDYEIRQGILSTYLVKPINVWAFYYVAEYAWKIVRAMLIGPVLIACLLWLGPLMQGALPSWDRVLLVLLSVALGYQVCFLMKLCLGCTGFWTNDLAGVATLYEVIAAVLGGVLIPLAFLPEPVRFVAALLPIQAVYTVPLGILTGKDVGGSPWVGIGIQVLWIVLLWLLARMIWQAGLRQYESVGG